jgi:hypothetical protein
MTIDEIKKRIEGNEVSLYQQLKEKNAYSIAMVITISENTKLYRYAQNGHTVHEFCEMDHTLLKGYHYIRWTELKFYDLVYESIQTDVWQSYYSYGTIEKWKKQIKNVNRLDKERKTEEQIEKEALKMCYDEDEELKKSLTIYKDELTEKIKHEDVKEMFELGLQQEKVKKLWEKNRIKKLF